VKNGAAKTKEGRRETIENKKGLKEDWGKKTQIRGKVGSKGGTRGSLLGAGTIQKLFFYRGKKKER